MKRDKHRITLVPYHGGARLARYYGGAALAPFGSRWVRGPYLQSRYNQRSKNGAPFTETSGVELGLLSHGAGAYFVEAKMRAKI